MSSWNSPFEAGAESATIDHVCSVLATDTRRAVVAYFGESATQTALLDDLTEYIATRQSDSDSRMREQVQLRLHHVGLPKLEDAGLIDYDIQTATVRYRERNITEEWDALVAEILDLTSSPS